MKVSAFMLIIAISSFFTGCSESDEIKTNTDLEEKYKDFNLTSLDEDSHLSSLK